MRDRIQIPFRIRGMDCAEEVAILKREVGPVVGGDRNLAFDILRGKMTVLTSDSRIDPQTVVRAVATTGMKAQLWEDGVERSDTGFWQRRGRALLTAASALSLTAGFVLNWWLSGGIAAALGMEAAGAEQGIPLPVRALYSLAVLTGGWYIFPKAWFALRRARPDMNLLMTIAVAGAIGLGDWFEAATVAFLFAVSLLLESWSVGRARRAVEALLDLSAPTVRVRSDRGREMEVSPEAVEVGTRILVKPGEKIPLDGRVVAGSSHVNQAPITGESIPVVRRPGDEVFAGTINGDGALEIETTKAAEDTTLAQIIRLVGEAQRERAPSEQWVEKFARYYTPAILGLAVAVLLFPPLLFGAGWEEWIYRSLVFLVIGCPCALVISTPVSIVAALAASARHGVLIKGGVYVEAPAHLRALAFDKTGTLTEGKPSVVEVVALNGHTESEVLQRAAALESRSTHPLALAIVGHARSQGVSIQASEEFQVLQGKGATGRVNGKKYWLGSHRYLEEREQETPEIHERLEELSQAGRTVVAVGHDQHLCGFISLADSVRPEARQAIERLKESGVEHLVMLTGDNEGTARAIGKETGVAEIHAELLPTDKVEAVERLVARYGRVAMVGDGVNDAPAMARASLGIAMGAAGSDAAIEAADIALMSDDLAKLSWLIGHSRRTLRIIRQNITLSIAVKVVFAALTLVGYASLWAAIAADMGVSLLVIFNALRLLGR
ncbi:MAG: heavy metal translocating P-type ATPase [Acidobacteriota bacterium]